MDEINSYSKIIAKKKKLQHSIPKSRRNQICKSFLDFFSAFTIIIEVKKRNKKKRKERRMQWSYSPQVKDRLKYTQKRTFYIKLSI